MPSQLKLRRGYAAEHSFTVIQAYSDVETAKQLRFVLLHCSLQDGTLCPTYRKPFDMLANGVSH